MHRCFWRPILVGGRESLESNELSICFKDLIKAWLNKPKVGWEEIKKWPSQAKWVCWANQGSNRKICVSLFVALSVTIFLSGSLEHPLPLSETYPHPHITHSLETFCPWIKAGNLQSPTYSPTLKLYTNRNAHTYSIKEILEMICRNPSLPVPAD